MQGKYAFRISYALSPMLTARGEFSPLLGDLGGADKLHTAALPRKPTTLIRQL